MGTRLFIAVMLGLVLTPMLCLSTYAQQEPVAPSAPTEPQKLTVLPASVLQAELKSARGGSFKLSDYEGKVLVLNLWATWVIPSRFEIPELVKLQKEFGLDEVEIVGLSTEDPKVSRRKVQEWIRDFQVHYTIGWVPNDVALTLMQGRDAIPQTFVITRTGRIHKRFIGYNLTKTPSLFREAIKEALNEN